jgi:hypothetical protein
MKTAVYNVAPEPIGLVLSLVHFRTCLTGQSQPQMVAPLAKTGGLADVSAALPKALARLRVDIRLVLPGYPSALRVAAEQRPETKLDVSDAGLTEVISARLPDSGLPVWLVNSPSLFRREGGLHQDFDGRDWGDNAQQFAHLTRVAARIAVGEVIPGWRATVLEVLPALLDRDIQSALIGQGGADAERMLVEHAIANRAKMAVRIGYDEGLAHRFYAAGDLLLHLSRLAEALSQVDKTCRHSWTRRRGPAWAMAASDGWPRVTWIRWRRSTSCHRLRDPLRVRNSSGESRLKSRALPWR